MVDSYDHLAVDWENALRPAGHKQKLSPNSMNHYRTTSPPVTSVFEKRNMMADGGSVCLAGSRRVKAEIARASRSDTRSDWSTTSGANFTYQLYLQCPSHAFCVLYTCLPP